MSPSDRSSAFPFLKNALADPRFALLGRALPGGRAILGFQPSRNASIPARATWASCSPVPPPTPTPPMTWPSTTTGTAAVERGDLAAAGVRGDFVGSGSGAGRGLRSRPVSARRLTERRRGGGLGQGGVAAGRPGAVHPVEAEQMASVIDHGDVDLQVHRGGLPGGGGDDRPCSFEGQANLVAYHQVLAPVRLEAKVRPVSRSCRGSDLPLRGSPALQGQFLPGSTVRAGRSAWGSLPSRLATASSDSRAAIPFEAVVETVPAEAIR